MRIHAICIGNEVLRGHTLNTNLAFIGETLHRHGYELERELCIPDTAAGIQSAVEQELTVADLVITVGGLGPTSDDLTRDSVAAALGLSLHLDAELVLVIEAYLARRGVCVCNEALKVQALVPDGALVLPNRNGTAPGLWCETAEGIVVMLPGPPRELQPIVVDSVMPRLRQLSVPDRLSCELRVCGQPESVVAEKVEAILGQFGGIRPAYCAKPGRIDVLLSTVLSDAGVLDVAVKLVRDAFARSVLPAGCATAAEAVGQMLRNRGWGLGTAESCTGGGIAASITDLPGASDFFRGALVTYANEWKSRLLGVKEETLQVHGAVSAETAGEMLTGLLERHDVQAGIVVTGIAGPAGGTAEKPVGLIYIGTGVGQMRDVRRYVFAGNRQSVRQRTVATALNQLRLNLLECE